MNFKKIYLLIVLLVTFAGFQSVAQNTITSPYSFVGLGDNFSKGNIRSLSMGGVDMALRSNIYINMMNPAGLSGIDSMSFVGSIGLAINNTSYRTSDLTSQFSSANINHLAIAFPITKWWKTAILLLPYSSVGYEVKDHGIVENGGQIDYLYTGSGGMDAINWTNAFNITNDLAFGLNASYYFGKLEHSRSVMFPDSAFIFNAVVSEEVVINGFFFEAGLQYYLGLDEENTLGFGLKAGNKSKLNTGTEYLALTYFGDELYNNSTLDTIRTWADKSNTIELPSSFAVGISWMKSNKLTIAADFRFEKWKDFKYMDHELDLSNKISFAIGSEFVPVSNTLSAYWKMIHYRVGFRYEHLGIKFADTEIKEYAVSVGFGLPLRKSRTMMNLGFELGQNGTIENDLIQERFFRVMLGVAIKETWFRKSKYL
ncbi:MAG: hypothetical protein GQ527_03270 [Bacteroidales bacterium]|nr:hypothetical protein [Bacteroidales bacterium]